MSMFCTLSIFLLFYRSLAEGVVVEKEEDPEFIVKTIYSNMNLDYWNPIDFRCSQQAYSRFNFSRSHYYKMFYSINPKSIGCRNPFYPRSNKSAFYPPLTALDPSMPVYIDLLHEGLVRLLASPKIPLNVDSKITRRTRYCIEMRRIAPYFADYIEIFHTEDETCWKIKEIVKECAKFRYASSLWAGPVYDRFCLGEDGCYTTMELYEDEMPHCVKYIANRQFQNATYGSWHHSIINYCQLTDMVPEAKHTKYDRSILLEDDKNEDDLLSMCQFLRFRLLPEEGKEEEIREITLEERDNKGTDPDTDRNIASDRTIYVAMMMLIYGF